MKNTIKYVNKFRTIEKLFLLDINNKYLLKNNAFIPQLKTIKISIPLNNFFF